MFEAGSTYKFDLPKRSKSIIKVIGVGGGGSNAVNHMFRQGIKDVEFVVCNTDAQALNSSPVPTKLQIGTALTEGLGCGANPKVGRAAAIESKEQIQDMLEGAKMVFITAGMGGGTGTGAAPVIAKLANQMDILTVGIVTMPFGWEGKKKYGHAQHGIDGLRQACDTVLVILNDQVRAMFGNLAISRAFGEADNVLTTAAKGIAEIITLSGYVNVDFQDVRTVMKKAGAAVMGSAETSGQDRALRAAEQALLSPLLDNRDIMGAKKILLSIVSGDEAELQMDELTMITEYIQGQAGDECEVIFGHGLDSGLGEKIRVTVIATGFAQDDKHPVKKNEEKKVMDLEGPVETENKIVDNPVDDGDREIQLKESPEIKPVENSENEFSSDEISNEVEKSFFEETDEEENLLREPEAKLPEIPFEVDFTNVEDFPKRKDLPVEEKPYVYDLFSELENEPVAKFHEDEVKDIYNDEELFPDDDEFEMGKSESTDEIIDEEGLMKHRKTKERLELQRKERADKLTKARKQEMSKEEFNDKWHKAAYQRRGVKLESTPHSSDAFISRYNLNDDNNLLGNNKFLHDNVD
jgi:cell division protein FtsZ